MATYTASPEGSPAKKRVKLDIFEKFRSEFKDIEALKQAFNYVCFEKGNSLIALQITSCNATASYGVSFSSASCETLFPPYLKEIYPFGSIFMARHGISLLKKFLDDPHSFPDDDKISFTMLSNLLTFLLDTSSHESLGKLTSLGPNESTIQVMVAIHFLSKLSISSDYTFDHHCKRQYCACGTCTDINRGYFGDTSIGNDNCWHGSLDIVFGSIDLFAAIVDPETDDNSEREYVEVNLNDSGLRSQILAQLITLSFLQKKRHLESMQNYLVPCIAISKEEIKFYFYDCEHDILLESRGHKIVGPHGKINYRAVICAWLVLNYKMSCSGLTSTLKMAPKSRFFQHAEETLDIYKESLKFKGVSQGNTSRGIGYRDLEMCKAKFVWPPEWEKPE